MRRLAFVAAIIGAIMSMDTSGAAAADPENTLYLDLASGRVTIELRPDLAPKHVARIKELTRQGFYDGIVFHRVIEGFMAQTGDPTGTGAAAPARSWTPSSRRPITAAAPSAWPAPRARTAATASSSSASRTAAS